MAMPHRTNLTSFLPSGDKARGASGVRVPAVWHIANVGEPSSNGVPNMNITEALASFVRADGKAHDAGTSYMALAVAQVWNAADKEAEAAGLIADMCNATGSVGKITKEFPKGKPNPQALKANGFSGLAEGARLLRKIASKADNEAVVRTVEGFLGVIQNEVQFEAHKAEDKRIVRALESNDEAKLARAEAAFLADYLSLTYPDRPTSFSSLRRALDKATTATGTTAEAVVPASGEGSGEEVTVSDAAVVIKPEDMAQAIIANVGELSDDTLIALFDAIKGEMNVRLEADTAIAA